jgi:hypothetical protein
MPILCYQKTHLNKLIYSSAIFISLTSTFTIMLPIFNWHGIGAFLGTILKGGDGMVFSTHLVFPSLS